MKGHVKLEATEEKNLVQAMKRLCVWALKFTPYIAGLPDRINIVPWCPPLFVEVKRRKKYHVREEQKDFGTRCWNDGIPVFIAKGADEYDTIMSEYIRICEEEGMKDAMRRVSVRMAKRFPNRVLAHGIRYSGSVDKPPE